MHVGKLEDEAAINAAWAILKENGITDGMLGVYYREPQETFVLHYEEEGSSYTEWVRLKITKLDNLPMEVLEEAGERLVKRIRLTRARHQEVSRVDPSRLN
jgi:hypothetical protein